VFDAKALVGIIAGSVHRAAAIGLPTLRPTGVDFGTQSEICFLYENHPVVCVVAHVLGALLVSYCVQNRIPISRRADKNVQVRGDSVVLAFTTTFAEVAAKW